VADTNRCLQAAKLTATRSPAYRAPTRAPVTWQRLPRSSRERLVSSSGPPLATPPVSKVQSPNSKPNAPAPPHAYGIRIPHLPLLAFPPRRRLSFPNSDSRLPGVRVSPSGSSADPREASSTPTPTRRGHRFKVRSIHPPAPLLSRTTQCARPPVAPHSAHLEL
jgi:hypothetical protein